jgi:hypothetical protein
LRLLESMLAQPAKSSVITSACNPNSLRCPLTDTILIAPVLQFFTLDRA